LSGGESTTNEKYRGHAPQMKHHLRRAALYILIPLLFAYILFSALSMAMPGDSALIVGGIIGLIFGIILVIQLDQKIRKIDEVRNANKGKPLKKWKSSIRSPRMKPSFGTTKKRKRSQAMLRTWSHASIQPPKRTDKMNRKKIHQVDPNWRNN
jgi:hypothetical protein